MAAVEEWSGQRLSSPRIVKKTTSSRLYSSYAHVNEAAGDKEVRTSRPGSDEEPHVAPLKYHLHGRLEFTRSGAEPADVEVLLDSGPEATGISEDVRASAAMDEGATRQTVH